MELDRQMESELKMLCCISFGCTYRILAQVLEFISLSLSPSFPAIFNLDVFCDLFPTQHRNWHS